MLSTLCAASLLFLAGCGPGITATSETARGSEGDSPVGDPEPGGGEDDSGLNDTGSMKEDDAAPCETDGAGLPLGAEGGFLTWDTPVSATRATCTGGIHAVAGPAGSTLHIRLEASTESGLFVQTTDLLGQPVADPSFLEPGDSTHVTLDRSGEFLVTLQPLHPGHVDDAPTTYTLTASCSSGCARPFTRYPVVFLHGMAGTDSYLGTLDYWYGVPETFEGAGLLGAWPAADALASIDTRTRQWSATLDDLFAAGLGRRFNLIGHSQGGLDARLLAHAHDPTRRVASITTVSAPHRGTVVADLADGVLDLTPFDAWLIDAVVAGLAAFVGLSGPELSDQIRDLTTDAMETFNDDVPDRQDVVYWSWAGASCRGLDFRCQAARGGEVIDPVFSATFRLLLLVEGDNDGIVSVESARWGTFLGELPADHMDEVGQIADRDHPAFDAQEFYLAEALRLQAAGL
ncbi:MAG: hypothetical protein VX265_14565 [Myxococcota bacterium]|nr:hypothetical protein [Myxococcota bacterium]MEC8423217.1 hypothetical protein [Myxococcota bacterium]